MASGFHVPDGNEALRSDIPAIVELIERTARWVHPDTFRALPVWAPHTARGRPLFDAGWTRRYTNTRKLTGVTAEKFEGNVAALNALVAALDVASPRPKNWTVCHIWGYDDENFAGKSNVVQDPRFYSCVGNMTWLPTPLKGFTDAVPEIKECLRVCAYHLYGWACEHEDVRVGAERVRAGVIPAGYPEAWPTAERRTLPPGTASYSERVRAAIAKRKARFRQQLADPALEHFGHDAVREVLAFWNVDLTAPEH